ncbi:hypothetical protein PA25_36810 [Pseudoalteromonas sp. A25]|uniref:hypothetical protein n=1 Tax=Pseudoalteromonas sp. A25 TaxID=116092 RepID=UPI001260BF16|nr:hypothetical protein [Pseudoalteromonas sp. A25]BBN83696.1 hypothetical protein PA25_36810 [Pseudoalteromonas sp. A25]
MDKHYTALQTDFGDLVKEAYCLLTQRAQDYKPLHKLSRRSAAAASIFVLISACYLLAGLSLFKSTPIADIKALGDIVIFDVGDSAQLETLCWSFKLFLAYLLINLIFAFIRMKTNKLCSCKQSKKDEDDKNKGSEKTLSENIKCKIFSILYEQTYRIYFLIVSSGISALLFFEWQQLMPVFFAVGLIIFILSYSINRKFGYTRAWSRNRLYAEKIRIIDARYKSGIIFRDKAHEDLLKLLEQYEEQTHQDTVNDYISYGNSALNTLKGLRK